MNDAKMAGRKKVMLEQNEAWMGVCTICCRYNTIFEAA